MKNKKMVYILIAIFIVSLVALIAFYAISKNGKENDQDDKASNDVAQNDPVSNQLETGLRSPEGDIRDLIQTTNLQSTSDHPIRNDVIEATNIEIVNTLGDLKITTTLKNHSNEAVEGFFIVIDLVDENGETVTTIAKNSNDTIEANGEFILTNYASQPNDKQTIKDAKITSLEKNSVKNTIENSFEQMQQDAIQAMEAQP